jgi:hypothetical protein
LSAYVEQHEKCGEREISPPYWFHGIQICLPKGGKKRKTRALGKSDTGPFCHLPMLLEVVRESQGMKKTQIDKKATSEQPRKTQKG